MKTNDQFRQVWPDTETPEPVEPATLGPAGFVVRVTLAAACVYLLTVFLFSL